MLRYAITAGHYAPPSHPGTAPERLAQQKASSPETLKPAPGAPSAPSCLLQEVQSSVRTGIDYIQLREKHLPAAILAALARALLSLLQGTPTCLLINGRPDVALATGCPGVHLPSTPGGLTPTQVRRLYANAGQPEPIISQACHTLADVRQARSEAPNLILFSPIFGKSLRGFQVHPPAGLSALQAACRLAHSIPVLALGGVTVENTPACLAAGASGVAGIRLFQGSLPTLLPH